MFNSFSNMAFIETLEELKRLMEGNTLIYEKSEKPKYEILYIGILKIILVYFEVEICHISHVSQSSWCSL